MPRRRKASSTRPDITADAAPETATSLSGTTGDLSPPDPYAGQWAAICLTVILPAQQFVRFGQDLDAFLETHASTRAPATPNDPEPQHARLLYCLGFGSGRAAMQYLAELSAEIDRMPVERTHGPAE